MSESSAALFQRLPLFRKPRVMAVQLQDHVDHAPSLLQWIDTFCWPTLLLAATATAAARAIHALAVAAAASASIGRHAPSTDSDKQTKHEDTWWMHMAGEVAGPHQGRSSMQLLSDGTSLGDTPVVRPGVPSGHAAHLWGP